MNLSRQRKSPLLIPFLAIVLMALAGCDSQQDDLNRYIAEVKDRPATPIPPIPAVRTYTPYKYEGLLGRDPFRTSTSEGSDQVASSGPAKGPRPDLQRPREYLERFELDTLEMVGTFAKESSEWALIEDPDGKLWIYTLNMDMMIHGGTPLPDGLKAEAIQVKEIMLDIMNRGAAGEF